MTADPRVVYGADRIRTRFNVVDTEHPGGHHGQDFSLPAGGGSEVVAYTTCTVVESGIEVTRGFTAVLGWYVVARTPLGRYLGWAHLRRGTRAPVGRVLRPGDTVGLAASGPRPANYQSPEVAAYDYPGTAWAGAHIHTTNGSTITSIFSGVGLIDPLPDIRAALTSLASDGGKLTPITTAPKPPTPTTPPPEEEDMDATQAKQLKETWEMTGTVKQLLAETAQWKGVVATLAEAHEDVAVIRQLLTETQQWEGIDSRLARGVKMLEALTDDATTAKSRASLTPDEIKALGTAIAGAGVVAKLDDDALARLAQAVNDERDARERARLAK